MIRLLIVVPVRLFREGLAQILGRADALCITGAHATSAEALQDCSNLPPDVVLLDVTGPDGPVTARAIAAFNPRIAIVGLGLGDSDDEVLTCAEAGISGYVTRSGSLDQLLATVSSVARGELVCSPRVAGTLARRLAALSAARGTDGPEVRLTSREAEVAALIHEDLSNKEIAQRLGIEVATVKNHVHNLLEKLHVRRRGEAARAYNRPRRALSA